MSGNAEPQRWAAKSFPSYRDLGGMLSRLGGLLNRNDKPPDIWNTNVTSENVFVNPPASASSPNPEGFNLCFFDVTEDPLVLTSTGEPVACGERQIPDTTLNPRC